MAMTRSAASVGQVRRIEIERHLEALLGLDAVAELLVELLADAVVHLDALRARRR